MNKILLQRAEGASHVYAENAKPVFGFSEFIVSEAATRRIDCLSRWLFAVPYVFHIVMDVRIPA